MIISSLSIPKEFLWRRLHSLTGLFFTLYLILHLYVNSQAGLWIGDDGESYIRSVNAIQEMPYLIPIEILFLGIPIILHTGLGILYLFSGKQNYYGKTGNQPYLPNERNQAYTWQRITAWILVFGVIAHVIHMRIVEYPTHFKAGEENVFITRLSLDSGLTSLAERLHVKLYNPSDIAKMKTEGLKGEEVKVLESHPIKEGEVLAVTDNFGKSTLLRVRDSFKMPMMMALYTLFVLASCYHGFNGLWSFMISWGVTITTYSQRLMQRIATALMVLVAMFGLAAIFLTYWVNLKQ
jgi:succinate dehydrogenase / fumarate reductase, cytochrome b subunit